MTDKMNRFIPYMYNGSQFQLFDLRAEDGVDREWKNSRSATELTNFI